MSRVVRTVPESGFRGTRDHKDESDRLRRGRGGCEIEDPGDWVSKMVLPVIQGAVLGCFIGGENEIRQCEDVGELGVVCRVDGV